MDKLAAFTPVLAGTYPIGINIPGSDLDIICSFKDAVYFRDYLQQVFQDYQGYSVTEKMIRGIESVIVRFQSDGFKFEIFGQPIPVSEQYAYRHMIIECKLLQHHGESFRKKIVALKTKGLSTEEAFANILGIQGDPYEGLLNFEL